MKLLDLNVLITLVSGIKDTKWNWEAAKVFLLGMTAGIFAIYIVLEYIEKRTDHAIEENLAMVRPIKR